ncbi:MAG: hypothetical protein KAS58_01630 [Calditrichia bacterium]|nr:hypothetical protein [Calditrichia bacterium]
MSKIHIIMILIVCMIFLLSVNICFSDEKESKSNTGIQSVSIGGQWFLAYLDGTLDDERVNLFTVTRGYINIKAKLNESLSGRITPDVSIDQEGDGAGDLELRLKYAYLKWSLPNILFFTKPYFELGLVHRPWLNYEENVIGYRVEGTMFLPRNGIVNSADFGVTFVALLGGEMSKEYQKSVSKSYPGRYGSIVIGVYNGGGYHAFERNTNKPIEGRITLRPFPDFIPGLQVSYTGAYGKGNTIKAPDWSLNMGYVSWETRRFILTGSYYKGIGDFRGRAIDSLGNSLDQDGYSAYGELKFPQLNLGIIARFDYFERHEFDEVINNRRYIAGISYRFYKNSKFLITFDRNEGPSFFAYKKTDVIKYIIEVRF